MLDAQRIVTRRHYDLDGAKRQALQIAGLAENDAHLNDNEHQITVVHGCIDIRLENQSWVDAPCPLEVLVHHPAVEAMRQALQVPAPVDPLGFLADQGFDANEAWSAHTHLRNK